MAAVYTQTMYSSSSQSEASSGYACYGHRPSYSGSLSRSQSYGRPTIELPRPLEPRPALHTSLSESSGGSRPHDVSHGPLSPDHRSQGQNLPAFRDIFSPGPRTSGPLTYNGTWNPNGPATQGHSRADSLYCQSTLHPPMVLQPPSDLSSKYHPPQTRPFEVPILNTSPVTKHPPQTLAIPPSTTYQEQRCEYTEHHGDKSVGAPNSSYFSNGLHGQYNATIPDEAQYRAHFSTHDQAPGQPYTPTSADSQSTYVGIQNIPGEGTFYVYKGGGRIPTHVDGESVNPAWGLTKANKPRKRLALACLDCREKKIKCEPGATSCLQCEKAKRTCRRAPAQSSQPDTTSTSPWANAASSPARARPSTSDPTPSINRDTEPDPLNKRRTREDLSPPNVPSKKHRSTSPIRALQDEVRPSRGGIIGIARSPPRAGANLFQGRLQSDVHYEWEVDPYAIDPGLTLHLVNLYFAHVNNATYCMYPRGQFLRWLENHPQKCQNERMVLYAMLATATIFAEETLSGLGKQFARIAGDAVTSQVGKFNLAMAQTHMILSQYHFSKGAMGAALHHKGSAVQSVRHQRLNTDGACTNDPSPGPSRNEFGFTKEQLAECRRRTFWSALFMDRCCGASTCDIKPEDVFVRLPCTDDMYERGLPSEAPYFSNGIIDPAESIITASSPIGPMAWLMIVSILWGNVIDFIFRAWYRSPDAYNDAYQAFYADTNHRLQGWRSRLPQHLQYSEENLDRSIQQGYAGTFISMHSLYHFAQIKLNRYMRHASMPELVRRNLEAANQSAHEMLQLVAAIQSARKSISSPAEGQPGTFSLSTPFPGYATLAAIDITSAGGWEESLQITMQEIYGGLGCLGELSQYWSSAKEQLKPCEKRYYQIQNILQRRISKEGAWLGKKWGMDKPLEQEFDDPEYDCVWGLGYSDEAQEMYFDTLKKDEEDIRPQPGGLRIA